MDKFISPIAIVFRNLDHVMDNFIAAIDANAAKLKAKRLEIASYMP